MTDKPLDPERARMIKALYGELSPEEMEEFNGALERDEALRRDWEELRAVRGFLGAALDDGGGVAEER